MEVHVEMKTKAFSVIAGLILVGIGVGYCLKAMNILPEFTVFFCWLVDGLYYPAGIGHAFFPQLK